MFSNRVVTENQLIDSINGVQLSVKREDRINPWVSGNKFRKLKYNFLQLKEGAPKRVLTFGGAFSNHLAAVAAAGFSFSIPTIGIVRGQEWKNKTEESPTLRFCLSQGMTLNFISREAYRTQSIPAEISLADCIVLPEGGTNELAIKGCSEILTEKEELYDAICCCVGTGGTIAGLIAGSMDTQKILGFPVLKHQQLEASIQQWISQSNWELIRGYEFGGYGNTDSKLIDFMNTFYNRYKIPLDPIYTGKMLFGIFDLIKKDQWRWGKNVLIVHSGGLQGIQGFNQRQQKKGQPLLHYC